jgi:hypothetical protein
MKMFRDAAAQPGRTITVPTAWNAPAMDAAQRTHDLMQIITESPVAHETALRATGAQPGTRFDHDLSEERCLLTNVCTNAAS